jgi:hypothetical protein
MTSSVLWDITPCSPLKVNQRFGRTYHFHLQGQRIIWVRNQRESRWQAELSWALHDHCCENLKSFNTYVHECTQTWHICQKRKETQLDCLISCRCGMFNWELAVQPSSAREAEERWQTSPVQLRVESPAVKKRVSCNSATLKRRLYVCCSYSETVIKSIARIWLVKTEKIEDVLVICKVCRSTIML